MKYRKRIASVVLAMVMVLAMSMPVMAATTASITITNDKDGHTYEAYQIFVGDVASGKLSNAEWGKNMQDKDNQTTLLTAYGAKDLDELLEKIAAEDDAEKFAKVVKPLITGEPAAETSSFDEANRQYVIGALATGYYLVEDAVEGGLGTDDAYSAYIVRLLGNQSVATKSTYPTVDKEVYDNADGTNNGEGWAETADHQIGESFQFKLTANIPDNSYIDAYDTYKLVFTDTMSTGVTFESIASVTITPKDGEAVAIEDWSCTAIPNQPGGSWQLTIQDIKKYGVDIKGATVDVIYNAHLNKDAEVNSPLAGEKQDTDNQNKVVLEYSNNPNAEGLGKTKEDIVFVFTYNLPGKKYKDEIEDENVMENAGFKLQNAAGQWAKIDETTGAVTWVDANADGTNDGTEIFSGADGTFKFTGLDVGTYTLVETTTPPGFNTIDPQTIVISATHQEDSTDVASVTVTMKVDDEETDIDNVINKSGATLPETGGIGTTIFYVIGAVLVIGAGILLVVRKRMSKEQ